MNDISIAWKVAEVAGAFIIGIMICIIISCIKSKTMEEKLMPGPQLLPLKLNPQELTEYRAAIERMEQARNEIFGLHYRKAMELKLNPSEIHIDTDGNIWKS